MTYTCLTEEGKPGAYFLAMEDAKYVLQLWEMFFMHSTIRFSFEDELGHLSSLVISVFTSFRVAAIRPSPTPPPTPTPS
jgi:hypothetical protein